LTIILQRYVLELFAGIAPHGRLVSLALAMLYFTLSWASPMRATPIQFLFKMRVVDLEGERLSLAMAALRSLLLIAAVFAVMTLFKIPENPMFALLVFPVIALLFITALTPNRQSAYDYLVGSIVVKKFAVKSAEDRDRLSKLVADKESRKKRAPTLGKIATAIFATGIPVLVFYFMALVQFDRELRSRIGYALGGTTELRLALEEFYLVEDRWGTSATELGYPTRGDYPDGGFYELEEDGVIRIRFTVIQKLKKISITVTPEDTDEGLDWKCRMEGDISQAILPSVCRI
jgi:uncharacterized RDD family membrane protein YckC